MGSASSVLTKVSKANTSVPFVPLLRNRVTVQNGRVCGDTHSMLDVLGASRARLHALSAPAQRSAATEGSWGVPVRLRSPPAGSRSALGLVADTRNGSRGDCAQRGDTRRRWAGQGGKGRESRQRAARRCRPSGGSGWRCSSISWGGLWGLNLQLDRIWSQMRSQRRASSLLRVDQSTQWRAEGRGWPPVARRRRPQRPRRSARPSWRLAGRAHPRSPSIRDLRSSTERVSRQLKGAASRAHFGFLDSACQAGNENRKCARHGAGWSGHLRPELGVRTLSAAAPPSAGRSAPNRAEPRPQSAARVARNGAVRLMASTVHCMAKGSCRIVQFNCGEGHFSNSKIIKVYILWFSFFR